MPHTRAIVVLSLLSLPASVVAQPHASQPPNVRVRRPIGSGPLRFEANRGQTDPRVRFLLHAPGYRMTLTESNAILQFIDPSQDGQASLRFELDGAKTPRSIAGEEQLPGFSNYLTRTPREWKTGIPSFARVRYRDVYDGIDLVYYGRDRQLEYDFVVAPGSDPSRIRFRLAGSMALRLVEDGDLAFRIGNRELRQRRPIAFQQIGGARHQVRADYKLMGDGRVGFVLGPYDPRVALTIDPVLVYSTFVGGSSGNSAATEIAIDVNGAAFVAGEAADPGFPPSCCHLFVTKYDVSGDIVYSTTLEFNNSTTINAIAVDRFGGVYFTGNTLATDFPVTAGPPTYSCAPGSSFCQAAYVAKLNGSGSALVLARYFGVTESPTTRGTIPSSIAVDGSLNVFLTGTTGAGFPVTPGAFQTVHPGPGSATGFVTKFNGGLTASIYSTYVGSPDDQLMDLAVDGGGNAYVTGWSQGGRFPTTTGAFQPVCLAAASPFGICATAVVAKLNAAGSALVYSTYLGGTTSTLIIGGTNTIGTAIAVDADGFAYVTGDVYSRDFPTTPGSLKPAAAPGLPFVPFNDAFVTKLNQNGSALVYSTYLGGDNAAGESAFNENALGIAVDDQRRATVVGTTATTDFPTVDALQSSLAGTARDGFVATLNASGSALTFSTYLGGSAIDDISDVAVNPAGDIFVVGTTESSDFPIANAAEPTFAGERAGLVARIGGTPSCGVEVSQVQVFQGGFIPVFGPFTLQLAVVWNNSPAGVDGPVAYVMDDLQGAVYAGSSAGTQCFPPGADPLMLVPVGSDHVLAPGEAALMGLWFYQAQPGPISYTPRLLAGYRGR